MRPILSFILLSSILVSCEQGDISSNERRGISAIEKFYGGKCSYTKSNAVDESGEQSRYIEISVRDSETIEMLGGIGEMNASNIALILYQNLDKERENYDIIKPVLVYKDGERVSFTYPMSLLGIVEKRMKVVYDVADKLKARDYDGLSVMINDSSVMKYNKNEFLNRVRESDSFLGRIAEGLRVYGFRITPSGNGIEILHVSGVLVREDENTEFSVELDLNSDKEEIYLFQAKL